MKPLLLSAALMAVLLPAPARPAEPLGRLFFTPAQRSALDAGKQVARPKQAGPVVRGPRNLTVNGIVIRSDGESTVWVNGDATSGKRSAQSVVSATPADPITARVQAPGTSARLRVGQSLDRSTGRVSEGYQPRSPASASTATNAAPADVPAAPGAPAEATEAAGDGARR